MPKFQSVKGTKDILPEEQPYWLYLQQRIHEMCQLYGYEKIDTPIFEETSLFERGVGEGTDIVDKEMYSFTDKGGASITLRPEFTAAVMRAYLEHGMHVLSQPVKLYSIGPIFRYEQPQAGRYRQHTQFNIEAIGEQDPAVDVEVISIAWHLYDELGFKGLSLQLNSTGCPRCRPQYLKILVAYYQKHRAVICPDCQRRLLQNPLRLLDCKAEGCQPIIAAAPAISDYLCPECEEHFRSLRSYLDLLGRSYSLNHRLVRGLDYYTKTVFEVWTKGIGAQNALCGGGRYDGLAEQLGGPPTPGVGFGAGLERIVLIMKEQGIEIPALPAPKIFIAYHGQKAKQTAVKLLSDLRETGVGALSAFGSRSLKAQMREANRARVKFVVIIGEDELAKGGATLKEMDAGIQKSIEFSKIVEYLKTALQ